MQEGCIAFGSDRRQLLRGGARGPEIARGEHDFDARAEQRGTQRPASWALQVRGLVDDPADCRLGGIEPALREPQLRQARLRLISPPAGFPVRLFRLLELAMQSMKLRPLVERHADGRSRVLVEELARSLRLFHGAWPRPVQLHDLGAVHQALPSERHQFRLPGAPVAQRRRPLRRSPEVEDPLAGQDHRAVDDPGHDRRYLTGRDRHHGLVEQPHTLRAPVQLDQGLAHAEPGERQQVRVAEAVTDLGGLAAGGIRAGGVGGHGPERDQGQQISLLDAVQPLVVEQPPGSGQPAAALGLLAPEQQEEGEPEAAAGGSSGVVEAQPLAMRTCPELIALVILARQVRGGRQPLEILGLKPRRVARGGELGIRLRPRLRIKGLPPPLQSAGHGHTLSRGTRHCTATTADRSRRLGDRSPDGRAGRWHDDNVALSISGPLLLGRAAGLARPGPALESAAASVSTATVVRWRISATSRPTTTPMAMPPAAPRTNRRPASASEKLPATTATTATR
jgi:hypothetical protein